MTREAELIRALAEYLALEILTSYTAEDFGDADFTSLGNAAVYLEEHGSGPGVVIVSSVVQRRYAAPSSLQELIAKVQRFAGTALSKGADDPSLKGTGSHRT
jgi:hypothetical protein